MAHPAVLVERMEFCDAFFPAPSHLRVARLKSRPQLSRNPFTEFLEYNALSEAVVRAQFTKAINDNNLTPGLKLRECGECPESLPPISTYSTTAFFHDENASTDDQQRWSDQIIPVVFRSDKVGLDSLDDNEDSISSYSELLCAVQHRVALFMLIITGTTACFVRWDRSGAVLTQAFSYIRDWEFFCDILWRISVSTDTQLGFDPTASRLRPGDDDYDRMTVAAEPHVSDVDERERDLVPGELAVDGHFVYKYVRTMFSESVNSPWPRYCVEAPDGKATRHFLIAKPTFRARGMVGRGTRGYVALDCKTGDFVWLKDAWRAHYLLVDKEGDVLRRLNDAEVRHVPTLVCHGDIHDQVTLSPDWWATRKNLRLSSDSRPKCDSSTSESSSESPSTSQTSSQTPPALFSSGSRKRKRDDSDDARSDDCRAGSSVFREDCPLRRHKHYRLVETEVCMPLHNFMDGQQLASLVLDCVYAHYQAYTKPKIPVLHRDISGGNILILPSVIKDERGAEIKWTGLLTDWEMAKSKDYKGQGCQPERTGTWQFLSVALLSGPKEVELCDELEAFFYVLLYYSVRYLRSNIDETAVGTWISTFFDAYGVRGSTYIWGNEKLVAIKNGTLVVAATNTDSTFVEFDSPMDHLLTNFLRWFRCNHIVTQYQRAERQKMKLQPAPETGVLAQLPDSELSGSSPLRRRRPRRYTTEFSESEDEDEDEDSHILIFGRHVVQPSTEDWALHKRLLEHKPMVKLLRRTIAAAPKGCKPWGPNDKVGDRVAKSDFNFPPILPAGPMRVTASFASNKRRKVYGPEFAVPAAVSVSPSAAGRWAAAQDTGVVVSTVADAAGEEIKQSRG